MEIHTDSLWSQSALWALQYRKTSLVHWVQILIVWYCTIQIMVVQMFLALKFELIDIWRWAFTLFIQQGWNITYSSCGWTDLPVIVFFWDFLSQMSCSCLRSSLWGAKYKTVNKSLKGSIKVFDLMYPCKWTTCNNNGKKIQSKTDSLPALCLWAKMKVGFLAQKNPVRMDDTQLNVDMVLVWLRSVSNFLGQLHNVNEAQLAIVTTVIPHYFWAMLVENLKLSCGSSITRQTNAFSHMAEDE